MTEALHHVFAAVLAIVTLAVVAGAAGVLTGRISLRRHLGVTAARADDRRADGALPEASPPTGMDVRRLDRIEGELATLRCEMATVGSILHDLAARQHELDAASRKRSEAARARIERQLSELRFAVDALTDEGRQARDAIGRHSVALKHVEARRADSREAEQAALLARMDATGRIVSALRSERADREEQA